MHYLKQRRFGQARVPVNVLSMRFREIRISILRPKRLIDAYDIPRIACNPLFSATIQHAINDPPECTAQFSFVRHLAFKSSSTTSNAPFGCRKVEAAQQDLASRWAAQTIYTSLPCWFGGYRWEGDPGQIIHAESTPVVLWSPLCAGRNGRFA